MKLRIKGSSLRLRLTKSEVAALAEGEKIREQISFGYKALGYVLQADEGTKELQAFFSDDTITIHINAAFATQWKDNNVIGISAAQKLMDGEELTLLAEKDFVCLDATGEDQSDNYTNPNSTC